MTQNYTHPAEHIRAFAAEVYDRMGATLPDSAPGELVRFDDPEKPRGNRACWAVLHLDRYPAGAFGNWRTGESHTWRADHQPVSREDRQRTQQIIEASRRERRQKRDGAHRQTAERARDIWHRATPATTEHPYIARKRIAALGVRVLSGELLVPLSNVEGELVNLQRIRPDGGKFFLPGGRVRGCYCLLAKELPEQGKLYICEGWATAATISAETRAPVVAAMNAGNLQPVAEAIRGVRPHLAIVIAADNDHGAEGNPGIRHGRKAARAVGGALTWPSVCQQPDCTCTDFNDIQNCGRTFP